MKSRLPVEAFTIELGNEEQIDVENAHSQTKGILNYLSKKKACDQIKSFRSTSFYSCKLENFIKIYAPIGGLIINTATAGNKIKAKKALMQLSVPSLFGQIKNANKLIAHLTQKISTDVDSILIARTPTAIVHEGMPLMKIMTKYKETKVQ